MFNQGYMANTYAEEQDKGKYRAVQWIFNATGAMIGALIAFGIDLKSTTSSVPHSVYIVFIVLQVTSVVFALLMLLPEKLVRRDGTGLTTKRHSGFIESLKGFGKLLMDWRIVIMIPTFFAGETSLVLQSSMNAYAYNLRTRNLNSVLTNIIQIPFSIGLAALLDSTKFGSRKKRGLVAIALCSTIIIGTYIAQIIWLSSWKFDRSIDGPGIDWKDPAYKGAVVIYMLYGAQYGMLENLVLWILGTLTNEPNKLAHMGGLFVSGKYFPAVFVNRDTDKSTVLSAGVAVAFGVDASAIPYLNESIAWFSLATISFPIMAFVVINFTTDSNYFAEADVVVPKHIRDQHKICGVELIDQSAQQQGISGKVKGIGEG